MAQDLVLKIITEATDKASAPLERVQRAAHGLSGELGSLKTGLAGLDKAQAQLIARNELQQQMKQQSKAILENRRAQKDLAAEIGKTGVATKKQAAEMDKLVKSGARLKKSQADNSASLERLNTALSRQGIRAGRSTQAQAQLDSAYRKTTEAVKRQEAAIERMSGVQQRAAAAEIKLAQKKEAVARQQQISRQKMQDAAMASASLAGISMWHANKARRIGGALATPVRTYAEAETAGTDLRVAMMDSSGKVSADYQEIDRLATRLGDRLPGTTADFKALMTMLIRQGMSTQTILGGTGEAAALLAVQLKKTPEAAAEMAAKLQDATRGTEKEMLAIMDQVQRMFYAGVEDQNILGAFAKFAPALDLVKVKGEEAMKMFGPLIGMLDQSGLVGESAGNALRKVFDRTMNVDKIEKTIKGMQKAGQLEQGFTFDFTDGGGNFGGMDNFYKQLSKLKGMNDVQKREILSAIWGDDAEIMQALNTMIEKGQAGYQEFAAKMEAQASLNQRVDAQLSTLTNLWDAASGTFTNFLATMGEAIAPQLKSLVEWIGNVNEKLSLWASNNPQMAATLMKIAAVAAVFFTVIAVGAGALAALVLPIVAAKTALLGLGGGLGILPSLGKGLMSLLSVGSKVFSILRIGLNLLGRAFLMNPIGLAIAVIVGVLYMLWKHWDTVKAAVAAGWQWIQTAFSNNPILNFIFPFIGIARLIINNWGSIKEFFARLWSRVRGYFVTAVDYFSDLWERLKAYTSAALQSLLGYVKSWAVVQWISDKINAVIDFLSDLGGRFYEAGKAMIQGLIDSISNGVDIIKQKLATVGGFIGAPLRWAGRLIDGDMHKAPGYSVGGYTGAGGVNEAAGIVHKGEVVFSQRDIARFGGWRVVEMLRRGGAQALAKVHGIGSRLLEAPGAPSGAPVLAGAIPVPASFHRSNSYQMSGGSQNITINIQGGNQSPQEIAAEVARQLKAAGEAVARRARSAFSDKD